MNAIENGRYDPSLPLAFAIARVFGRRIEDVFTPDAEAETGDDRATRRSEPAAGAAEGGRRRASVRRCSVRR